MLCALVTIEACKERAADSPESREMAPNSVIQTTDQQNQDVEDEPLLPESDEPAAELEGNGAKPSSAKAKAKKK